MRIINTEGGEYVVYRATEDRKCIGGDVRAGDWLFEPAGWQGDTYSASYATAEAAEDAAREWVDRWSMVAARINEIDSSEHA